MRARVRWNAAGAGLLAAVGALAACDGPGNTGRPAVDPELVRQVPWLNGALPAIDADGGVVIPDVAAYPPIAAGLPDPGSRPADCGATAGYTFEPRWFDDFEPLDATDVAATGVAKGWASYDDLSKGAFHTPGDATWYPALMPTIHTAWGLPAEHTPGPQCGSPGAKNEWVLHFRGGLFRRWGAGISHAFTDPDGTYRTKDRTSACDPPADFCPPPLKPTDTVDTAGLPTKFDSFGNDTYQQSHDFFDVSSYDGIAFWARRGPEGFDRALVILTDKFTSDRLARENQTFCRRARECHTRCLSGSACAPEDPNATKPVYRCWDPASGVSPTTIAIDSERDLIYPRCGQSACTSPASFLDLDFDGKECRPYTTPNDGESGEFCWNPGDPPPPDRDERCQDGWQTSIQLTTDWQFYALPWSLFEQVGFGKRAPYMDLKSLDTMAFGAPMGWSDMFFDNVTLYRKKP